MGDTCASGATEQPVPRFEGRRKPVRAVPGDPRRRTGMAREIQTVGVVGLGTMGAGIAEVLARHGLRVIGVEVCPDAVLRAHEILQASTSRALARGKLTEQDRDELLDRIQIVSDFDHISVEVLVLYEFGFHFLFMW
jgi:3-hydroxybutyryl-CoA dehydrogenase